ncbi:bifunctional lysine-specific demethylase and histidyl-hydroxylase NO66-like [Wyeomyia smithii]|uniref:bifunctional lysine-specific demethylase and histidyl-hydroxylase NO66-like n=1 Tax=Wyeomyia smithii TaxID=174621 RepID=UPI002467B444|nr:bifunctional lysine-specific demethylase and histidyl-hydroxylase NO66-like [Wyeomyia smithii]XP_055542230.1 bifunctional lysine-specific demethylase and histidyl-hydroxylase NO66-like [Wyeomyia smithii]
MARMPSIFDSPLPVSWEHAQPEQVASKQSKKKKASPATKQQMINQILQEHRRELVETEPAFKNSKKKNTSTTSSKTKASSDKKKGGLKIKLQEAKSHKRKLRKSLEALNHSRAASKASDSRLETSLSGTSLNNNSNYSTPSTKKKASNSKNKSPIMPLPLEFTPSRVVVKKEPETPSTGRVSTKEVTDRDSAVAGRQKLSWIIQPVTVDDFMAQYWEKKPLLVQRNNPAFYSKLLSRSRIDEMLRKHNIEYTKNIDVTSYREGERETHNPDGRVLPPDMWSFYEDGCSIRMLNPQTYLPGVYDMNVKLQEFFHCMTGANFYLTPPNSQGFAPHYDDIEAFVLQVEGRKHWKLYSPRDANEVLPRVSSPNFKQEDIGVPILDVILEPGDLLYFPRGIIHQACTVSGHHSLHVTMSVYQKNSWADLLELFLPHALAQAAETNLNLRQGIPLDLHQHFGIVHSDNETPTRKELVEQIKNLFEMIFSEDAIDTAVDQMTKRFQHDALPPLISADELPSTVYGANYEHNADGTVSLRVPFTEKSTVRLLRRNILRLINEEGKLRIYYHTDNSREYHEYEPNFLEVDQDAALAVELLVKIYPQSVTVADFPVEDKVEFAKSLWEKGLVIVR